MLRVYENQIYKPSSPPLPERDFLRQYFLDTLLFIYSISACLHSKYWGWKILHQTYVPPELIN